jgi:N-acetylglucosaminyldiphosphoundecaprenol N-acetyl-beta-D-mannosaminyltransferase
MQSGLLRDPQQLHALKLGEPWRVQTVNLHHIALAERNAEFRNALSTATYRTADGWPVVSLLRAANVAAQRVTGSDWLREAVESGRLAQHRIALIGGDHRARDGLKSMLGEALVYTETGDKASWTADGVASMLDQNLVDVCIIAVTPPFGDIFASEIVSAGYNHSIIAVGGSVDMLIGTQKRAPRGARALRLEWLWRMASNPQRLARRYLLECLPTYALSVLPQTIKNRTNR